MMRVISSPSSSTTGFFTLILAIRFPDFSGFGGALDWRGQGAQPRRCASRPAPLRHGQMPALDKHDTPLPTTTVKWRFPSVHPDGRKYVVIATGVTLLAFLFHWGILG